MEHVAKKLKTGNEENDFQLHDLADVVLTASQEAELEYYDEGEGPQDLVIAHHADDEGSESPGSDTSSQTKNNEAAKHKTFPTLCAYEPLLLTFSQFIEKHCTSDWNMNNARYVYQYLDVSACIVHPNYLLAVSGLKDVRKNTLDAILARMEEESSDKQTHLFPPWSAMPSFLTQFLDLYDGFEDLCDRVQDTNFARKKLLDFMEELDTKHSSNRDYRLNYWFVEFSRLIDEFVRCIENPDEKLYEQYVKLLLNLLVTVAGLPLRIDNQRLQLKVPARGKAQKNKIYNVMPDIVISRGKILLVGEVKKFGCHEAHRGSQPKGSVLKDSATAIGIQKPVKSSSTGKEDGSSKETYFSPCRALTKRERYKIRCYLPQLLGQMLAAMQNTAAMHNTSSGLPLGTSLENVQLGFAVEGFKLRFVKLTLWSKDERPTVKDIFTGQRFNCDVFLTREFNLFKKEHLRMLFKTILAICKTCTN